jgi:hypothetical protein
MPAIILTKSLTDDLTVVASLGSDRLQRVARAIESLPRTIDRSKLRQTAADEVGDDAAETLIRFLFGLAVARRHGVPSIVPLLDDVRAGLTRLKWKDEDLNQWDSSRPILERLLNLPSIITTAKALDLSYDFARVCVTTRILTDIRPVFEEDNGRKTEIIGATITQTLRIEYNSPVGNEQTISFALDLDDIKQLMASCEEAVHKAEAARLLIEERCRIPTIMPGQEGR